MLSQFKVLKLALLTLSFSLTPMAFAETIKVGVMTGNAHQVAEEAAKIAKQKFNLDVELIEFSDYVIPNEVLNSKEIDLNAFQHKPFLDEQIASRDYKLVAVGNTFVYPIAAYSKNIKSLSELKEGSSVTLPNDPTNLGRSLLLLEKQGLITLDKKAGLNPSLLDVIDNPLNLELVELEAPLLVGSLDDETVAFSIINTTYSSDAGLSPTKDGLFVEDKDSLYANIIAAREDNKDSEAVKQFVEAYQSEEVYQKAYELFDGGVIKAW